MSQVVTITQAIEWTTCLTMVYVIVDSAEQLYNVNEFKEQGFFSWKILLKSRFFSSLTKPLYVLSNVVFDFYIWLSLLALRGVSAFLLVFLPKQGLIAIIGLLIIFIISSLINFRNRLFGAETANRLALMITGALFLRSIEPTELITLICLWFIALQSCFSYLTAGASKLVNKDWRKGDGIFYIVNSPSLIPFGKTTAFFDQNRSFGKMLTWLTISIECIFPFVLFIGRPFFWLFLIWGITFHLCVAIWLRLGKFFWIWVATYPAIIFIAQR